MEDLLVRVIVGDLLLLFFDLSHQLFSLMVGEGTQEMQRIHNVPSLLCMEARVVQIILHFKNRITEKMTDKKIPPLSNVLTIKIDNNLMDMSIKSPS